MSISTLVKEYEWSKKGVKSCRKINGRIYRQGKSMLLAISNNKTIACKLIAGPVDGEIFNDFIMNDVIKDQIGFNIFLDNARIHHYNKTKDQVKESGNLITYNVPYHPEYNPIEYINYVIKGHLKAQYVDDINILEDKLTKIIDLIKPKIYQNCFNKAYKCISVD